MKMLTSKQLPAIAGGYLDVNMADCYEAKMEAIDLLLGPGHYDVLEVADSLRVSCPMEYPDPFSAFNAAIQPFMDNPMLL